MYSYIKLSSWITATLIGLSMMAVSVQAASFDCAKAASKVEKLICGDAELSKLDEELNAAYKTALQEKQQAASVRQTQKRWIDKRNACQNTECLKNAYLTRINELNVMASAHTDTVKQGAKDNSPNDQRYSFVLTKGNGVPVCDAYLERLNTSTYEKPPYCDRPESDVVKGFTKLNRVPLSPADVHDLFPIVSTFLGLANQKNLDWADMNLQKRLTQTGQSRLTEAGSKSLQMDLDGGWAKMWRYEPPIDIDNDGVPDNVEVWHGSIVRGVGGRQCGESMTDIRPGLTSLRQPQIAFVVAGSNDRLDVTKTRKVFEHPARVYHLDSGNFASKFRPIGNSIDIFKYQNMYYFDTFFDHWGDFENKRKNDRVAVNSLAVFLHKDGKTSQVCEYLMAENETSNKRGAK